MENATNSVSKWVHEFGDDLFTWAKYKTNSIEIAEDLVQETFLSAFKAFDSFKGDSEAKTWLFSILNNKILDYFRKKIKSKEGSQNIFFDENGLWIQSEQNEMWNNENHLLDNPDFNLIFKKCINHLPEKWRIIIESKRDREKNSKEICKDLNITKSNYWQMMHRAKLQLKSCLEQNWKEL